MLEHHHRQPSLPIIDGQGRPASYVVFCGAGAGATSQQLWPFLPGSKNHSKNDIRASCDGFLIARHGRRLYICNPVIRRHALLPLPYVGYSFMNTVIGFYRHHPTEDYRVLWVSQTDCSKYSLHNLTVGSDESRHITVTMPAASSRPSVEWNLLRGLTRLDYCPPPVQHRGSLHWCPRGAGDITEGGGDIIVFDTIAESFRWMHSPAQLSSNGKLFNMKGMLAFWASSTSNFTTMDVWVMLDYEAEIWVPKYRIDVSMLEASRQLYLTSYKKKIKTPLNSTVQHFNDMVVLNEGELLVKFNGKHVLRCDTDGKFLGIVNLGKSQYCMSLTPNRFQESIVPIPYHEMHEEDEESPFSTGHV